MSEDLEKSHQTENVSKPNKLLGIRHVQYLLLCLSISIGYGMRTNLSVALIAMTDENPPYPGIPTYPEWNNTNTILSSFFWGYILPQVGAGQLSERFGPKWFLAVTMAIGSIFTILTPVMASLMGSGGVMLCRVVQGFNQGFIYPSVHNLLSKWAPNAERSLATNFVYGGGPVGVVISMPLTGFIADSASGWPMAFYLYGVIGLVWSALWMVLGANSPADSRMISDNEQQFIVQNTEGIAIGKKKKLRTPWRAIVRSLPLWAVLVAHCGQEWGHWTLLTEIPNYMKKILKQDIQSNSLLSALPYFVFWLLNFAVGPIADRLITRNTLRAVTVRKIFESIGSFVPAVALIWLGYLDETQMPLAITLLTIAVGSNAASYCGYLVNCLDLTPNFAGTVFGISTCIANIFSLLAPLAVQFLGDDSDPILWRTVFILAGVIYSGTNIFYLAFASGDIQPWNDDRSLELEDATRKCS